jgi:hypothetical protein
MIQTASPKALPPALRRRINKWAHSQALRHESAQRAALTAKIQRMADAGAAFEQLDSLLVGLELAG